MQYARAFFYEKYLFRGIFLRRVTFFYPLRVDIVPRTHLFLLFKHIGSTFRPTHYLFVTCVLPLRGVSLNEKKCTNPCICQKKAVPLHAILKEL